MERKLFRSGNSIVLALPREMIDSLEVQEGDVVTVELDQEAQQIIIAPARQAEVPGIDPQFARQVAEFIEEYRAALQELARK